MRGYCVHIFVKRIFCFLVTYLISFLYRDLFTYLGISSCCEEEPCGKSPHLHIEKPIGKTPFVESEPVGNFSSSIRVRASELNAYGSYGVFIPSIKLVVTSTIRPY